MKKLMCAAIVGVLGMAFQMNAFAASAQLVGNAAEMMGESQIAQKFLGELKLRKGASQAELQAAVGKLDAAQQSAVVGAINAFAKKATKSNGNQTLRAQNEQVAKTAFMTSNGQMLQVAAMVTTAASRENVTNGQIAKCDETSYAQSLAAKAEGVSFADIDSVLRAGVIQQGVCGANDPIGEMNGKAIGNLIQMGKFAQTNCLVNGRMPVGEARDACWINAEKQVLGIEDAAAAKENLAKLDSECHFMR